MKKSLTSPGKNYERSFIINIVHVDNNDMSQFFYCVVPDPAKTPVASHHNEYSRGRAFQKQLLLNDRFAVEVGAFDWLHFYNFGQPSTAVVDSIRDSLKKRDFPMTCLLEKLYG
jgi:hypothetical protein